MEKNWTDEQIVVVRARLAEAKRQGLWISAVEVGMFLGLLTWWQRATTRGYRRANEGRPPTVGDMRAEGVTRLFVTCAMCGSSGNSRRLAFDDLHMPPGRRPVPDHAAFIDIPNLCRFRCVRCGSRKVSVMADRPTGMYPSVYDRPDPLKGNSR